ncbi:MAG: XdhC family protein [Oscillospiraceae bacterium]
MKEILNTMLSALTRGEGVMLCSILKADGSSPRGAGAHMAVFSDGTALGTVGGGAVERQSILLARELLKGSGTPCGTLRSAPRRRTARAWSAAAT